MARPAIASTRLRSRHDVRSELKPVSYSTSLVTDQEVDVIVAQGGRHSPKHVEAQIALGDRLIAKSHSNGRSALASKPFGSPTAWSLAGRRSYCTLAALPCNSTPTGPTPADRRPETFRDQMAFTPYVFEDIGNLIDQSHDDLYLFSSDNFLRLFPDARAA